MLEDWPVQIYKLLLHQKLFLPLNKSEKWFHKHLHNLMTWIFLCAKKKKDLCMKLICNENSSEVSNPYIDTKSSPTTCHGSCLGGVMVSVLATRPKVCGFEPGQGDWLLRVIKIRSTPSSRMGSKARRSHVVRFYGMLKNSWSPTGMDRLNSHFLRPSPVGCRDVSGDGQSALVDKRS
jgi:hypothetical protein